MSEIYELEDEDTYEIISDELEDGVSEGDLLINSNSNEETSIIGNIEYSDEDDVENSTIFKKLFYNTMSRNEYLGIKIQAVTIYKEGGLSLCNLFSDLTKIQFPEYTPEFIALVSLMKGKTAIKSKKSNELYDVASYPIDDRINHFKYYWSLVYKHNELYRPNLLRKIFPKIIENVDKLEISDEEIKEVTVDEINVIETIKEV